MRAEEAVDPSKIQLDLGTLLLHASWPVKMTVTILVASSVAVWVIGALKIVQLARMRAAEESFEQSARRSGSAQELVAIASKFPQAVGVRIVDELRSRGAASLDRLRAAADRAIVTERKYARSLLTPLGSIATSAPFVGLFGTVYGIMDAFVRIGAAKSASLPVVAPAIGEALVTTAIGLAVAIPAVVFYNSIDKRVSDLVSELEASAGEWVVLFAETPRGSERPMAPRAPSVRPERG
jgi:biopolymer transport protein TolQ